METRLHINCRRVSIIGPRSKWRYLFEVEELVTEISDLYDLILKRSTTAQQKEELKENILGLSRRVGDIINANPNIVLKKNQQKDRVTCFCEEKCN